jgi:hypothetical protein
MTNQAAHQTRLERILGVPLAEDAVRQWPQSGERIDGRARIGEVEAHFVGCGSGSADAMTLATPSWWSGAPTMATVGSTATSRSPSSATSRRSA